MVAGRVLEADAPDHRGGPEAAAQLATYARELGGYDEMLAADGSVRPHWQAFMRQWGEIGPAGWQAATDSTRRLLRESGIAFNVYADPDDRAHAWRLDLVPVLLPEREWRTLERGLIQRARLVEAVLRDVYGEARLLRSGLVPAPLVLGSDEFLRPAARLGGLERAPLMLDPADIARTAEGHWRVLADQTDIAIGNGYLQRPVLRSATAWRSCSWAVRPAASPAITGSCQQSLSQAGPRADGRIVVELPGRRTRPTSATPTLRATSATPWRKVATSPFGTTRFTSKRWTGCSG